MKIKSKFGLLLALAMSCGFLAGCAAGTVDPDQGGETPVLLQYKVTYDPSEEYTITGLTTTQKYFQDTTVNFAVTVNNPEKQLNTVTASAGSSSITVNETTTGYSFKMPEHDVKLKIALKAIPKYELELIEGVEKKGLTATYALNYGGEPQAGLFLQGEEGKVEIDGATVTFLVAGEITLTAIFEGEVVTTLTVNVADSFHGDTPLDPLSVKEALDLCEDLQKSDKENKYPTPRAYYVKGVITEVLENDDAFQNATLMLGGFEVYRGGFAVGLDRTKLIKGAVIVFKSKLLMFNTTPETHSDKESPTTIVSVDISEPTLIDVDTTLRSVQVGTDITLKASIHPLGAEGKLTWETKDENITVTADAKDDKKAVVHGGDAVGTASVTVSYGTVSQTIKIRIVNEEVHGETPEDPLTVAKAIEICNGLESSTKDNKQPTDIIYYVKGIVTKVDENDPKYSNATAWLGDFEVYRAGFADDVDRNEIIKGAEVVIRSQLLKFGTTCETHDGAKFISTDISKPAFVEINTGAVRSVQLNKDLELTAELHPVGVEGKLTWESADPEKVVVTPDKENGRTAKIHGEALTEDAGVEVTVSFGTLSQKLNIRVVDSEVHGETEDDPINAEKAVEICKTLDASSSSNKKPTPVIYYVKDIVTEVVENNTQYKNASVNMGEFYVYRAAFADGVDREQIVVGAEVVIKSQLLKFGATNSKYETHDGALFLSVDVSKPYSIEVQDAVSVRLDHDVVVEATVNPVGAEGELTWKSADEEIATVTPGEDNTATIHGVKAGEVDVTVSIGKLSQVIKVSVVTGFEKAVYSFKSTDDAKETAVTDVDVIKGLFKVEDGVDIIESVSEPKNVYQKFHGGSSTSGTYYSATNVMRLGKSVPSGGTLEDAYGNLKLNLEEGCGVKKVIIKGYSYSKKSIVTINKVEKTEVFKDYQMGKAAVDGGYAEPGELTYEFEEAQTTIEIAVTNPNKSDNMGVTFVAIELYKE